MSAIFLVFGAAVITVSIIFLSKNSPKRAMRQRKTHAVLAMLRKATDK